MALTLGAVRALAAWNRMVWRVTTHLEACKPQPLASPPPLGLGDGLGVKSASPPDAIRDESRGRRRAVKRKQQRVVLRALGVWPDGHWDMVPWQRAEGETADTWPTFWGELSVKGVTEKTTAVVVSDGAPGLESALDDPLYGVAHPRCLLHTITQRADSLGCGAREGAAAVAEHPTRKATRQRQKAIVADAGWG